MNIRIHSSMFVAVAFFLCGCGVSGTPDATQNGPTDLSKPGQHREADIAPIYTVVEYDIERNPARDLAATVEEASISGKRIILEIGGQWWGWCRILDGFVHENQAVATTLRQHFLIMKVNYGDGNNNEEFLANYPKVPAYPHFFVLESDGTFLHSQGTAELEEGKGYNEQVFLVFLDKWKPG